jgi:flagellar basal body-associated protein FliL
MKSETTMLAIAVALTIALVGGLVAMPVMVMEQKAQADKGGVPNSHSNGHGHGRGGDV